MRDNITHISADPKTSVMDYSKHPLTNAEIVILVHLLMPIVVERRNKEPFVDFPEDALLTKLMRMRESVATQE